eukprot:PhF_6_TR38624/c5_g3_i1/m.57589
MRARYLIPPVDGPWIECVCHTTLPAKEFVVHALDCKKVTGHTWATRHALVKRTLIKVLKQYDPDPQEHRYEDGKGPDILFQLGSQLTAVDVTIVNPLTDTYVWRQVWEAV